MDDPEELGWTLDLEDFHQIHLVSLKQVRPSTSVKRTHVYKPIVNCISLRCSTNQQQLQRQAKFVATQQDAVQANPYAEKVLEEDKFKHVWVTVGHVSTCSSERHQIAWIPDELFWRLADYLTPV